MKRLALPLTLLCLALLAGCSAPQAPTVLPSSTPSMHPSRTPMPVTATATSTRVFRTSSVTKTEVPPTPLSPTLTPYPTLNLAAVQTATPAAPAVCPPENLQFDVFGYVSAEIPDPEEYCYDCDFETALKSLQNGATITTVDLAFQELYGIRDGSTYFRHEDINSDGVKEMIVPHMSGFYAIGCTDLGYQVILTYEDTGSHWVGPDIYLVEDINRNGVAEILILYTLGTGDNLVLDILEWNGKQFAQIIENVHMPLSEEMNADMNGPLPAWVRAIYWYLTVPYFMGEHKAVLNGGEDIEIYDLNGDGIREIILSDGGPLRLTTKDVYGPWRGQRLVYQWDGLHFLLVSRELDPPVYRFQAAQDADRLFLLGEYDQALKLYQEVIFSDQLQPWTPETREYLMDLPGFSDASGPTPTPPVPDPAEYEMLSAYARYRILLNHLARGWDAEAQIVYDTLLEKVQPDSAGAAFRDLATILWDSYQDGADLNHACALVVEQVEAHPEIVENFGSDQLDSDRYLGDQSHIYQPADLCPFEHQEP